MSDSSARLLLSRRFGPLFAAQFLGAFNDNLLKSALGVLAAWRLADRTGIDAGALAMLASAVFIAPFVLFSGAAGTLADRMDKSRIARWVNPSTAATRYTRTSSGSISVSVARRTPSSCVPSIATSIASRFAR